MCEEWRNDFKAFYDWSMSHGYSDELTINRIDNSGNYEPNNCRWIELSEQSKNRSSVILLTYNGKTQNVTEWAKELNLGKDTIRQRYHKGWSVEECLFGKRVVNP